MKAAWYEKQGAAWDVLVVGEMDDLQPRADEVRIRVAFSGVNPGDVKKREDAFGVGMPYELRKGPDFRWNFAQMKKRDSHREPKTRSS
jgi:NADPH:quinone reductase-like Zn-dependent oxidoreductase